MASSRQLLKTSIIAAFAAIASGTLHAQTAARGYVFAGAAAVVQDGATDDAHRTYLEAPGGKAGAWFVGGGVRLARWVALEAELRRTGVLTQVEPSRYFITYSARRRDTIVALGARLHPMDTAVVAIEPVVTMDFVREESWLAQTSAPPYGAPHGTLDSHLPYVDSWGRALGLGMDVRVGRGRVSLAPGVRFRRFFRGQDALSAWPGGRAEWAFEAVAAARLSF